MRVIAVVMGEPDSKTRNAEVSSMLDYAFAQYKIDNLLAMNENIGEYEVDKGKERIVKVVPQTDATVLRKKSEKKGNATYEVKMEALKAPLKKGDKVGQLYIKENGKIIRTINLTVNKDIPKANIFELYLQYLKDVVTSNISL